MVIGRDHARADEDVVLDDHVRRHVGVRLYQDVRADARPELTHGVRAEHRVRADDGVLTDHDVVAGLAVVAKRHATVDDRPRTDVTAGADAHRPALAGTGRVTEFDVLFDHRSRPDG